MTQEDNYTKGLKKLLEMGREDTMLNQRQISEDMYQLSVGTLFGEIWNRPHLSLRDRQLITLAANIALARPHGTHSHYRSAHHIGITHEEICEIMIHVGMYGDWPCIAHATSQYLEVLEERGDPMAKSNPKRDEIKEE
ncbi:MAG: carboxymuconolactone decarboxylase family protein [Pseudomonadota bacterium]|nr:carboxymuconolactone decarboxylase family protein [Pseudomonadota bacterium]